LIDIIPFLAGENHPRVPADRLAYVVDVWVHQNIGAMYDHFVCQQRMFKKPDPMCNYMRANRDLPKETWDSLRAKRRCVYLVWVHDTPEEEEKGLQIWEVAWWNFEKHVDEIAKNPKGGAPVPFSDYDDGKCIAFSIKKSGTFTDAGGKERDSVDFLGHRFTDRDEPIPDEILNQSFSLDDCINVHPPFEVMEEAFPSDGTVAKAPAKEDEDKPSESSSESPEKTETTTTEAPDQQMPEVEEAGFECPGGGTPGLDIEKLPECSKCEYYDPCSDLADSSTTPAPEKEEPKKEEKPERKRIVRRRS
jgi:hypothetical protein